MGNNGKTTGRTTGNKMTGQRNWATGRTVRLIGSVGIVFVKSKLNKKGFLLAL